MANATVAFVVAVRLNYQLSSKVGGVLAKLLRTRLDGDELFKCYKDLWVERKDLGGKVESIVAEKEKLTKVVSDLEAWLKELESMLEESELRATKEREANKELEEELLVYKKKAMEQHEKGF